MKRVLAGSVLLVLTPTGSAAARAKPLRPVLVYAEAKSTTGSLDTEQIYRRRPTVAGRGSSASARIGRPAGRPLDRVR